MFICCNKILLQQITNVNLLNRLTDEQICYVNLLQQIQSVEQILFNRSRSRTDILFNKPDLLNRSSLLNRFRSTDSSLFNRSSLLNISVQQVNRICSTDSFNKRLVNRSWFCLLSFLGLTDFVQHILIDQMSICSTNEIC